MMHNKCQQIGVIVGPTAVGKTALSLALASKLNAEIISADSIQVYQGLDIGSAKPTAEERGAVPHHLVDIIPPDEPFSVADFQVRALACIKDISSRGKLPLVVGGTGLYINSLVFPLDFTHVPANAALRKELEKAEASNPGVLHKMLGELDPYSAKRLHANDKKRIIRAIEVFKLTGQPIGQDFCNRGNLPIPYDPIMIGLDMPRDALYGRINLRVDKMLEQGLVAEVQGLLRCFSPSLPAFQGLGYKQLVPFLQNETTLGEAVDAIKQQTRRFAKRQLTWFRRDTRIHWFDVAAYGGTQELAAAILPLFKTE